MASRAERYLDEQIATLRARRDRGQLDPWWAGYLDGLLMARGRQPEHEGPQCPEYAQGQLAGQLRAQEAKRRMR